MHIHAHMHICRYVASSCCSHYASASAAQNVLSNAERCSGPGSTHSASYVTMYHVDGVNTMSGAGRVDFWEGDGVQSEIGTVFYVLYLP